MLLEPTLYAYENKRGFWNGEGVWGRRPSWGGVNTRFPSITLILVIPLVQRRKCLSTKPTSENVGRACRYYDSGSWASGAPWPAGPSATRIWQDVVASLRPEMGNYQTRFSYFLRSSVGVRGRFLWPRSSRMGGNVRTEWWVRPKNGFFWFLKICRLIER